jgi:uncharacterized membrane protein
VWEFTSATSSPIPPAAELAAYDQVLPGLADRIVRMAETQLNHVHAIEMKEVEQPFQLARRGQWYALSAMFLILVFATVLVYRGSVTAGAIVAGIDVLGIVTVFVTGKNAAEQGNHNRDSSASNDDST